MIDRGADAPRGPDPDLTVASYGTHARTYRERTATLTDRGYDSVAEFVATVGRGGRVLEIGSGGGRDAAALEAAGLSVRRTDITPQFVDLLRADGHRADVLDPLRDDLTDPHRHGQPYDAVWTNACLLHIRRVDLPTVLTRLRGATRTDGTLYLSVKEGVGEEWVSAGNIEAPRFFVYWTAAALRPVLESAGWVVDRTAVYGMGDRQRWLHVWAHAAR